MGCKLSRSTSDEQINPDSGRTDAVVITGGTPSGGTGAQTASGGGSRGPSLKGLGKRRLGRLGLARAASGGSRNSQKNSSASTSSRTNDGGETTLQSSAIATTNAVGDAVHFDAIDGDLGENDGFGVSNNLHQTSLQSSVGIADNTGGTSMSKRNGASLGGILRPTLLRQDTPSCPTFTNQSSSQQQPQLSSGVPVETSTDASVRMAATTASVEQLHRNFQERLLVSGVTGGKPLSQCENPSQADFFRMLDERIAQGARVGDGSEMGTAR